MKHKIITILGLLLALTCLMALTGCPKTEITKDELLKGARDLYAAGNYDEAITAYNLLVSKFPNDSDGYAGLGWCYAKLTDTEQAIGQFQFALERNAADADSKVGLAGLYIARKATGDLALAVTLLTEVFKANAGYSSAFYKITNKEAHLLLAEAYVMQDNLAKAQEQLDLVDPANNLDDTSETYKSDIILAIERLRGTSA